MTSNETPSTYQQLCKWYANSGLYQSFRMTFHEAKAFASDIQKRGEFQLDCYCPQCRDGSVFSHTFDGYSGTAALSIALLAFDQSKDASGLIGWMSGKMSDLTFRCARSKEHSLRVIVNAQWESGKSGPTLRYTKIGQFPSKLDLLQGALTRYSKIADEVDLRELRSAALCRSHGLHVAAFAYLRRVFERRLEVAHGQARADESWMEEDYDPHAMRMDDRISALAAHLPRFLVENRVVYKILSRGIHELTEGECEAAYSAVDEAIGLILDEELERRERARRTERAKASLSRLAGEHG